LNPDRRAAADRSSPDRIFVDYTTGADGPSLVVFAALHGDERAGAEALERVREALAAHAVPIRGRLRGVLGNIAALETGERYIDRDLNRHWWEDEIEKLEARPPATDTVEDREMRSLLEVVAGFETELCRPVVFLDLHSTSADGLPFTCIPDTISNLKIALELPIPVILNLEETIDGPLMGYLSDLGYGGVIVEGGRHDDPRTVDVLESSIWILLAAIGCVRPDDVPRFEHYHRRLADLAQGLPRVLEVKDRHNVDEGDGFRMEPGFTHHTRVVAGQLLATDNGGQLRASRSGRILMPLYKPPADIGYFLTQDIPAPYVRMLYLLRWLRLDRIVHWLPGAMRDSENPNLMRIETWVPERLVDLVRLLGWRRLYRGTHHSLLRRRRVLRG
jgi:succinylglutamate desuccinylase